MLGAAAEPVALPLEAGLVTEAEERAPEEAPAGRELTLIGPGAVVGRMVALPVTAAEPEALALPEAPPAPGERVSKDDYFCGGEVYLPPAQVCCWS